MFDRIYVLLCFCVFCVVGVLFVVIRVSFLSMFCYCWRACVSLFLTWFRAVVFEECLYRLLFCFMCTNVFMKSYYIYMEEQQ